MDEKSHGIKEIIKESIGVGHHGKAGNIRSG